MWSSLRSKASSVAPVVFDALRKNISLNEAVEGAVSSASGGGGVGGPAGGGGGAGPKVARAVFSALIVRSQVSPVAPAQSPPQPVRTEPGSGVAVSVTELPFVEGFGAI